MKLGVSQKLSLLVCILVLMLPACGEGGGCGGLFRADKGGVPVTVERVKVVETSPVTTITGKLVPNDRADISYPNDVKVSEVNISVGQTVAVGEPLFRIEEDELNSELSLARARRAELEALIEKNTNLLRSRENLLEEGKVDQGEITRLEKEVHLNEAELGRVKAYVDKLTYNLDHAVVTSPVAGMVTQKNISPGSLARAGEVLISIVNINPVVISFALDAGQAEDIAVGTPLNIIVSELPEKSFTAKVTYISPELHRVGNTFDVWAAIPNDELLLKAGMTASTEFVSDTLKHTYVVPASAVISKDYQPYVYTVDQGVAHKMPVVVGSVTENQIEVLRGINKDDIVVVKGGTDLFDGADVRIWK